MMSFNLVAAIWLAAFSVQAQETAPATPGDELYEQIREIEIAMAQVEDHAAKLERYVERPSLYGWRAHSFELARIKERVNEIGDLVPKIQDDQDIAPWQKDTIDRIASMLAALAEQTDWAIRYVDEHQGMAPLFDESPYGARVESIYQFARHINELVDHVQARYEEKPTS